MSNISKHDKDVATKWVKKATPRDMEKFIACRDCDVVDAHVNECLKK